MMRDRDIITNPNRKSYVIPRTLTLSMTLNNLWRWFHIIETRRQYVKNTACACYHKVSHHDRRHVWDIIKPHRSTTYADVAYRYSMVCRSVCPAKSAEPIEMPFGLWNRVGRRKHVLDGVFISATWRVRLNRPRAVAMRPFCQTLTLYYIIFNFIRCNKNDSRKTIIKRKKHGKQHMSLWSPYVIGHTIIFSSCFFLLFYFLA